MIEEASYYSFSGLCVRVYTPQHLLSLAHCLCLDGQSIRLSVLLFGHLLQILTNTTSYETDPTLNKKPVSWKTACMRVRPDLYSESELVELLFDLRVKLQERRLRSRTVSDVLQIRNTHTVIWAKKRRTDN